MKRCNVNWDAPRNIARVIASRSIGPAAALAAISTSTVPPSCESKPTPVGAAVSSIATPPPRAQAAATQVPPELAAHPRYRILEFLGAGGMGTVFKAEHRLMERVVALKIIRKDRLSNPDSVARFRREARAAARLSHPNIVLLLDSDQEGAA